MCDRVCKKKGEAKQVDVCTEAQTIQYLIAVRLHKKKTEKNYVWTRSQENDWDGSSRCRCLHCLAVVIIWIWIRS